MKPDIHPDYVLSTVHCSCGNEFVTRGTQGEIRVELCNECHPFYTGKQKLVDTGGRVERYKQRYAKSLKQRSDSEQEKSQAKQAAQAKKSGAGKKA